MRLGLNPSFIVVLGLSNQSSICRSGKRSVDINNHSTLDTITIHIDTLGQINCFEFWTGILVHVLGITIISTVFEFHFVFVINPFRVDTDGSMTLTTIDAKVLEVNIETTWTTQEWSVSFGKENILDWPLVSLGSVVRSQKTKCTIGGGLEWNTWIWCHTRSYDLCLFTSTILGTFHWSRLEGVDYNVLICVVVIGQIVIDWEWSSWPGVNTDPVVDQKHIFNNDGCISHDENTEIDCLCDNEIAEETTRVLNGIKILDTTLTSASSVCFRRIRWGCLSSCTLVSRRTFSTTGNTVTWTIRTCNDVAFHSVVLSVQPNTGWDFGLILLNIDKGAASCTVKIGIDNTSDQVVFDCYSIGAIQNNSIINCIVNDITRDLELACSRWSNSRVEECMEGAIFDVWSFDVERTVFITGILQTVHKDSTTSIFLLSVTKLTHWCKLNVGELSMSITMCITFNWSHHNNTTTKDAIWIRWSVNLDVSCKITNWCGEMNWSPFWWIVKRSRLVNTIVSVLNWTIKWNSCTVNVSNGKLFRLAHLKTWWCDYDSAADLPSGWIIGDSDWSVSLSNVILQESLSCFNRATVHLKCTQSSDSLGTNDNTTRWWANLRWPFVTSQLNIYFSITWPWFGLGTDLNGWLWHQSKCTALLVGWNCAVVVLNWTHTTANPILETILTCASVSYELTCFEIVVLVFSCIKDKTTLDENEINLNVRHVNDHTYILLDCNILSSWWNAILPTWFIRPFTVILIWW